MAPKKKKSKAKGGSERSEGEDLPASVVTNEPAPADPKAANAPEMAPPAEKEGAMKWAIRLLKDKAARMDFARETFNMHDVDGSGGMDVDEMCGLIMNIAGEMHLPLPPQHRVRELVALCDKNGDGSLQLNEFFTCFKNILESAVKSSCVVKIQAAMRGKLARNWKRRAVAEKEPASLSTDEETCSAAALASQVAARVVDEAVASAERVPLAKAATSQATEEIKKKMDEAARVAKATAVKGKGQEPAQWRICWAPGPLAVDGNLQPTLAPLAHLLKQYGFLAEDGRSSASHIADGVIVSLERSPEGWVAKPSGFVPKITPEITSPSKIQAESDEPAKKGYQGSFGAQLGGQVTIPFSESLIAAPKPTGVWGTVVDVFNDVRKVADSLNNGHEFIVAAVTPWDRHLKTAFKHFLNANGATPPLRTGYGLGTEWNIEAITALQSFLRARGFTELALTNKMGLFGTVAFGWCEDDPTVKALQLFLNTQMVGSDGKGFKRSFGGPTLHVDADADIEFKRPFSGSPQKQKDNAEAEMEQEEFNEFKFWKQSSPTLVPSMA